jgi:hypothetical protein
MWFLCWQAVEENTCAMKATAEALKLGREGVVVVSSYLEALGVMAAHKAGINPAALTAQISPVRRLE